MPAVFYGRKRASTPITVSEKDFIKIWKQAGESTIVILKDGKEEVESLVYSTQRDPVTERPIHADFYTFDKGQKMKVGVPIEFTGESPAVKNLGGVLVKVFHEVEIEAEPKNLPPSLVLDISSLETFDSVVLAKDIKLPEGVTLVTDGEEVAASVYEPKEEEEEPVAAEFDPNAIEVEKKGKEEIAEGEQTGEDKKEDKSDNQK